MLKYPELHENACAHGRFEGESTIYRVNRKFLYKLRGRNVEGKIRRKYPIPLFLNELYFRVMSSIGITEVVTSPTTG